MRRNLYAALTAVVLTACGDPSGSSGNQQGSLRFDYTGAATGSYLAEAPAQDTAGTTSFALARALPLGVELDSRPSPSTPAVGRVRLVINQKGTGPVSFRADLRPAVYCPLRVRPGGAYQPGYRHASNVLADHRRTRRGLRGRWPGPRHVQWNGTTERRARNPDPERGVRRSRARAMSRGRQPLNDATG